MRHKTQENAIKDTYRNRLAKESDDGSKFCILYMMNDSVSFGLVWFTMQAYVLFINIQKATMKEFCWCHLLS